MTDNVNVCFSVQVCFNRTVIVFGIIAILKNEVLLIGCFSDGIRWWIKT